MVSEPSWEDGVGRLFGSTKLVVVNVELKYELKASDMVVGSLTVTELVSTNELLGMPFDRPLMYLNNL